MALVLLAPLDAAPAARTALAVAALMIVLWATEAVDHALAGFVGVWLFWALEVVPPQEAFSGFASETPWFLFGAMLIGQMTDRSGLARRLAFFITARFGGSYPRVLLGFVVVSFLLTFLVPSGIARVTILGTIAVGAVQSFGVLPKSNIGRGLLVVITYTATIFDKMLIAGAASILARGIIEKVAGVPVLYSHWFVAFLPADLITIAGAWWLVLRLYPPERAEGKSREYLEQELARLGPWSLAERKCAFLLATAVTLWMTDFAHHLSPSLVGLAVGLTGLLPRIGVLEMEDAKKLNYGALWFTAAALSMGRVLQQTGGLTLLTDVLGRALGHALHDPMSSAIVLYWTGFLYHFFLANETAMLSTSLPVVLDLAIRQGTSPLVAGMIWTFGSGAKIFTYQSAVLVVGYSFGHFEAKDMFKLGLALSILEGLVLMLLVTLYWPALGIG